MDQAPISNKQHMVQVNINTFHETQTTQSALHPLKHFEVTHRL